MIYSLVSIYLADLNLAFNENKLYKTLDYWSRDMLNLDFSGKGVGIISPPHFAYNFSRKMFLMLYSITLSDTGFFVLQKLGERGRVLFALPPSILTFVLQQQWCSNVVSSFISCSRVHKTFRTMNRPRPLDSWRLS